MCQSLATAMRSRGCAPQAALSSVSVRASHGFSLIVVLMLLLVVSVLGLAAAQNALVGERIA
ncbi:PilX N-terminal domain-containing pilus assembly protein, partial [Variovorax paradoxus]|uniref:PilX N-terminal domain-containing pilus assembly protein n=1 Tax=Variovorax paradoxus TaxID=34073 RepID=UPI0038D0D601